MTVVVDPVDFKAFFVSTRQLCDEIPDVMPTLTDPYATAAIILVRLTSRVIATLHYVPPAVVVRRFAESVCFVHRG
jgi:hypothetical protein